MDNDVFFFFKPWKWGKAMLDTKESVNNNRPLPRTYKKEIEEQVLTKINITFYQRIGRPLCQVEATPNQQLSINTVGDYLLITVKKTNKEGNPLKIFHQFQKADIVVYTTEYETVKRTISVRI